MKRTIVALLSALSLSALEGSAHAAPNSKPTIKQEASRSSAIAHTLGELRWGMSRDEVVAHFTAAIKEKYKPLLAKSTGALEQDKLRASMRDELTKLRASVLEFDGKKTGADVSFLKGEFTHRNGESMLKVSENSSENYYFFINDKLWKWYKAFDSGVFESKSFAQFSEAIQGRYGKAQRRDGEAADGKQSWLEWQDESTRLRAVDNKQFYGFYCLVFEDKATLRKLPELRTTKASESARENPFVELATSEKGSENDVNSDIVDRITGKTRRRPAQPDDTKKGEASKPVRATSAAPSEGGVSSEDDPLKGLGL